jgi:hypothetical protein
VHAYRALHELTPRCGSLGFGVGGTVPILLRDAVRDNAFGPTKRLGFDIIKPSVGVVFMHFS